MALGLALAASREIVVGDRAMRAGTEGYGHAGNVGTFLLYGKRVSVTSPVKVRIDVDGEAVGFLPALFEIQPGSIEFITPR